MQPSFKCDGLFTFTSTLNPLFTSYPRHWCLLPFHTRFAGFTSLLLYFFMSSSSMSSLCPHHLYHIHLLSHHTYFPIDHHLMPDVSILYSSWMLPLACMQFERHCGNPFHCIRVYKCGQVRPSHHIILYNFIMVCDNSWL